MKQAIINMVSGNYTDVIALFNAKRWFTWININVLPHPDSLSHAIFVHGSKFMAVSKNELHAYFVFMLGCNVLQPYTTFRETSISKMTYKYRKWLGIAPYGHSAWLYKGTLIKYAYHNEEGSQIKNVIRASIVSLHNMTWGIDSCNCKEFPKYIPWVIDVSQLNIWNSNNYKNVMSSLDWWVQQNDYVEMLTNALDAISNLWFIDSDHTKIQPDSIVFKFTSYKLLLWIHQWTRVELQMPGIYVGFNPWRKLYSIPNRWSYCHPHVSSGGSICLWDFSNYINTNRKDIQWALINIYDLLCTYNTNSPYRRPDRSNYNSTWENAPRAILTSCTEEKWVYINWSFVSSYEDFRNSSDWWTYWYLFD